MVGPPGPGRHQPLRRRRLRAQQRRRRLSQPDVPLPADRGALRRLDARRRARLPGARRADVLRRARLGADHVARRARSSRRCASTTCRPTRTAASGSRRSAPPATSSASRRSTVQRRRDLARARRCRPTSEILDWVARDAETALHPSCTCRMGVDDDVGDRPRLTRACTASTGVRVVDASSMPLRHQRQHLRPGDDAGREGRRPHPRQHPAGARIGRLLPSSVATQAGCAAGTARQNSAIVPPYGYVPYRGPLCGERTAAASRRRPSGREQHDRSTRL